MFPAGFVPCKIQRVFLAPPELCSRSFIGATHHLSKPRSVDCRGATVQAPGEHESAPGEHESRRIHLHLTVSTRARARAHGWDQAVSTSIIIINTHSPPSRGATHAWNVRLVDSPGSPSAAQLFRIHGQNPFGNALFFWCKILCRSYLHRLLRMPVHRHAYAHVYTCPCTFHTLTACRSPKRGLGRLDGSSASAQVCLRDFHGCAAPIHCRGRIHRMHARTTRTAMPLNAACARACWACASARVHKRARTRARVCKRVSHRRT